MTNEANPPKVARWLLWQLAPGPHLETVDGDLAEPFRAGRSRSWYWRQVLLTVVVTTYEEITRHKMLAIGALFLGWISIVSVFSYGLRLLLLFNYWMVWSDWAILTAPEWL